MWPESARIPAQLKSRTRRPSGATGRRSSRPARRCSSISLTHELLTILARTAGIVAAVLLVAYAVRRGEIRGWLGAISGAVVAALVLSLTIGQMPDSVSALSQARRAEVGAEPGRDQCFSELGVSAGSNLYTQRLPFALWARRQMGVGAVYDISLVPPPDDVCLYSALLPALPAAPGQRADWTIAFGAIPPVMKARIAAHDPAVRVYAPGLALQSNRRPR